MMPSWLCCDSWFPSLFPTCMFLSEGCWGTRFSRGSFHGLSYELSHGQNISFDCCFRYWLIFPLQSWSCRTFSLTQFLAISISHRTRQMMLIAKIGCIFYKKGGLMMRIKLWHRPITRIHLKSWIKMLKGVEVLSDYLLRCSSHTLKNYAVKRIRMRIIS